MPLHDNEIIGSLEARDLRGIIIADEANGLTLCTEYLGFESYDMKMSENEVKMCHAEEETERVERKKRRTTEENVVAPTKEVKREFPPPLSSLNGRGQRSFYLRPVRKDGRLELTRVMIDRPEVFHASRENGRLRLHLITGTTKKDDISSGNMLGKKCFDNPIKACDSEEVINFKDDLRDNIDVSDQLVNLSKIKDDSGTGSLGYKSNEEVLSDDNGAEKWRYENCYNSRNHDEYDYHYHQHHHHHHQHHHHIRPYHHCNNNNKIQLWSQSYVKTR